MKWLKRIIDFYISGFKNMSLSSKKLWVIVFIKLFIMFAVLKAFFFPNLLNSKYSSEKDKANYVGIELINKKTVQDSEEQKSK